jgi:hypothetical protein
MQSIVSKRKLDVNSLQPTIGLIMIINTYIIYQEKQIRMGLNLQVARLFSSLICQAKPCRYKDEVDSIRRAAICAALHGVGDHGACSLRMASK